MTVVLISFFALFRASSGPPGTANPVQSIEAPAMLIHTTFLPTAACDTVCQLRANSAHATWTSVGNVTVDGVVHNLHFSHNGKILGLRSVQGVSGNSKRDDVDDDGGVVAAYFWENDSQTA